MLVWQRAVQVGKAGRAIQKEAPKQLRGTERAGQCWGRVAIRTHLKFFQLLLRLRNLAVYPPVVRAEKSDSPAST
jgi:hypothetical protein